MSFRYCFNIAVSQLERCSKGGKITFWGGQNFWDGLLFSEFSVDLQKRRKKGLYTKLVFFFPKFLLISKKKKKVISLNCSAYFLVFCCFPKKSHHFKTAARERGLWMGMLEFLGGQNFCLGGCRPLLPPRSCSPAI